MYFANSPFWLKWIYPTLIWHKSRKEKTVFLSFDDGPIPDVTPFVLNTLKSFNAKATFFCIGENVVKHPEIYKQILADGHSVGNHTYNHLKGWDTKNEIYLDNITRCAKLVKSNLFRPPYGRAKKSQLSVLNTQYSIIMWDVLSGDFDTKISPQKCLQNVIDHTKNGSIIVFHDSIKAFPRLEYALPLALKQLASKGFQFKSIQ
jgi:peptidoglycan/xylan/chitin deacetylase (PgdA/CDA1 family)